MLKETSPGPSRYYAPSTTANVPLRLSDDALDDVHDDARQRARDEGLTVQVRKSGSPVSGTRVDVQGGPSPGYYLTGVTNGSGNTLFDVPQTAEPVHVPPRPPPATR